MVITMGKIFYVMGKSSSGKDTIFRRLFDDMDLGLKTITGYTTRPMRQGEVNGREYYFVNEKELAKLTAEGKVIEQRAYETIHGMWYYFTVNDENVNLKTDNYILIGTLESYAKVNTYYGDDIVVPIYIEVEDGERLLRAAAREKSQENPRYTELCRRFIADSLDFAEEKLKKLGINKKYENKVLETCYEEIKADVQKLIK